MRKFLYFLLLFLSCRPVCNAQDFPELKFNYLTAADGLSSEDVRCIIQDKRGIMWISTHDGLNRYDGTGFKTYYHVVNDSTSISHSDTRDMALDDEGMLWIGTYNGLCRFNPVTGKATNYYHSGSSNSLADNYACTPFIDSKKRLWLATHTGVQLFDYKKNSFTTYTMPPLPNEEWKEHFNEFRLISEDDRHRLWALSFYGVYLIDEQQDKLVPYYQGNYIANIAFYQASDLSIYLGQWSGGIKKFFPDMNRYENIPTMIKDFNIVNDFTEWKDNNGYNWLVVSIDGGLILKDPQNGHMKLYQHDIEKPFSINTSWLTKVYKDKDNRLWIASDKGVNIVDPQLQYFTNRYLYQQLNKNNAREFGIPRDILETGQGYIMSSWYQKGLFYFDKNWNLTAHKKRIPENSSSRFSGSINGLYKDYTSNIWFATDSGLVKQQGNSYKVFVPPFATSVINEEFVIRDIVPRKDGKLWLIARRNGLYVFDPINEKFVSQYKPGSDGLEGSVYSLCTDKQEHLWAGTTAGLFLLDEKRNIFQEIKYKTSKGTASYENIYDLLCDRDNTIWLATQNGLGKLNPTILSDAQLITTPVIPDAHLYSVREDTNRILWIKSMKGIIRYNKKDQSWFYTYHNGLPDFYNNYSLFEFNRSGSLLSGQAGVITEFNPYKIELNKQKPGIVVCDVFIDNRETTFSSGNGNMVKLEPGQKTLQVHFSITSYTSSVFNKLFYKIPGISNEWVIAPGGNINFSSLPIGKHILYLKGSNNDGVFSDEERISIIVSPYWYQTVLFRIVAAIMTAALIFAFVRWRIRSVRKESSFKQKIAETEMLALRAQMNPHFIFNSLNSIENFIMKNEKRMASDYLNKFARLIRMILDSTRDELVPVSKDMEALQLYVDLEQLRFNHKFDYTASVDAALLHGDYRVPSLLIQPFVENAIVHGLAHSDEKGLHLVIKASLEEETIKYVIEDNGIGRKKSQEYKDHNKPYHRSVGMKITEDRIHIFNQQAVTNGSVRITDLYTSTSQAAGTRVEITIKAVS